MDDSFLASVERNHRIIALLLLLFFAYQGLQLISLWSPTGEERLTVGTGLIYLQTGEVHGDYPPLIQTYLALPYALGLAQFEIFVNEPPLHARYANLFLALLCALLLYFLALKSAGPLGAITALSVFCLSPNILANSALATIDVGAAFLALLFVALLEYTWQQDCAKCDLLAGLALGLAIGAKFENIALIAIAIVVAILKGYGRRQLLPRIGRHLAILFVVAWLIFSLSYSFTGLFVTKGPMRSAPLLRPIASLMPTQAYISLGETLAHNSKRPPPFIGGNREEWTRKYYLPTVFGLKTPLGLLILLLLIIGCLKDGHFVKDKRLPFTLLPPLVFFLFLWLFDFPNRGYRQLLPVLLLLYLLLAQLTKKELRQGIIAGPTIVISLLLIFGSWWDQSPHHLCYVNSFAPLVSADPFIFTGSDCDWGQNEYLLAKELAQMPKGVLRYVNPYPTTVPLAGAIAINANNYVQRLAHTIPIYDWLALMKPYKILGGTWALYFLSEKDLRQQAKRLEDRNAQMVLLRFLIGRGAYKDVIVIGRVLQRQYPTVHHFLALAHIGSGDYLAARAECKVGALNKDDKSDWYKLLGDVCENLLGTTPGAKETQLARALCLLYRSPLVLYQPIIEKLERHPLFNKPITPHHPAVELRKVWALKLFKEGRYASALALFESLKGERLHQSLTDKMRQCRELVELSRKENLAGKAEFAYKRMFYGHGEAMDDLRRLWEGNRSDATILRYALNGLAIRRGICRPFQTGESKLFDDVSSSGLWRDPKKVKASVRQ